MMLSPMMYFYTFHSDIETFLILKTSLATRIGRKQILFGTSGIREVLFYKSKYASRMKEFQQIPKTYYLYGSRGLGEMVIIMEDLQGATPVNHLMGNQIWKVPDATPIVDKIDMLHAMFLQAACWHAQFWKDPSILNQQWMRNANYFLGQGRHQWEKSIAMAKKGWNKLKENSEIKFPAGFQEMMDKSYSISNFDLVVEHCKSTPWTLTHGDYHAANIMVSIGAGKSVNALLEGLKVLNWSKVGPWEPTTDLALPCVSDLPRQLYPQVHTVLKEYHKKLTSMGVDDFSWEDCQSRFGESGMEHWIWTLGSMAHFPCPAILFQYFVDQMEAFWNDFCPRNVQFTLKNCGIPWKHDSHA